MPKNSADYGGPTSHPVSNQVIEPKLAIPFERRRTPRRPTTSTAMAVFAQGHSAGTLTRVEILDTSFHGVALKSPLRVDPGTSISLIPDNNAQPRQIGIVVRCAQEGSSYTLGVQCRLAKSAA